jgi:hypothetical protein
VNAQASVQPACVVCGRERIRTKNGHSLCDSDSCFQVTQGTRDKDKVGGEGGRALYAVPSPCASSEKRSEGRREEPELLGLIRDHGRGELEPVDVRLGELPESATAAMLKVAENIRLLLGLRLAVSEDRPLPYSTRFCAELCGLRDHREASRVLGQLEQAGVIQCAGKLKPRGMPFGTKLYQAPGGKSA